MEAGSLQVGVLLGRAVEEGHRPVAGIAGAIRVSGSDDIELTSESDTPAEITATA